MSFLERFFLVMGLIIFVILSGVGVNSYFEKEFNNEEDAYYEEKNSSGLPQNNIQRQKTNQIAHHLKTKKDRRDSIFSDDVRMALSQHSNGILRPFRKKEIKEHRERIIGLVKEAREEYNGKSVRLGNGTEKLTFMPNLVSAPISILNSLGADKIVEQIGAVGYVRKEDFPQGKPVVYDNKVESLATLSGRILIEFKSDEDMKRIGHKYKDLRPSGAVISRESSGVFVDVPEGKDIVQVLNEIKKESGIKNVDLELSGHRTIMPY